MIVFLSLTIQFSPLHIILESVSCTYPLQVTTPSIASPRPSQLDDLIMVYLRGTWIHQNDLEASRNVKHSKIGFT